MSFESWLFFMSIWTLASLPLGPNALNCIATSAAFGFGRGLWSVFGVFVAANIHMALALSGIAVFLHTYPVLFEVLRWLGVAYLAWMGVVMLRTRGGLNLGGEVPSWSAWRVVGRAIAISLTNPKAIFVWLAIFTQFIDGALPLLPQFIVLAPSALAVTLMVYTGYCGIGLGVKQLLSGRRKLWFDRLAGSAYLAFAVGLASADLRKN